MIKNSKIRCMHFLNQPGILFVKVVTEQASGLLGILMANIYLWTLGHTSPILVKKVNLGIGYMAELAIEIKQQQKKGPNMSLQI